MIRRMAIVAAMAGGLVSAPASAQGATNGYGYQNGQNGGIGNGAYLNGQYPGGGGGYPGNGGGYPGGYPGSTQSTKCESNNGRTQRCALDTSRGVSIGKQYSDSPCIQGRTWGYDRGGVWVSNGCRASFIAGRDSGGYPGGGYPGGGYPGGGGRQVITCESQDNRPQRCGARIDRGARLVQNLSDRACVEGRNWGWDRGGVWVNNGCRGRFELR